MRGTDTQQSGMFSYLSPEERVPEKHPLRAIRGMTDEVLKGLSAKFNELYSATGRPSIAPEKLLRGLLLQILYTVRSERLLMEQLQYNLLFRWFVGLNMEEPVWVATVFTKNRERLLEGEIADLFFAGVLAQARAADLLSDEHFSVDGTLIEAWAGHKSFQRKKTDDDVLNPPPPDPGSKMEAVAKADGFRYVFYGDKTIGSLLRAGIGRDGYKVQDLQGNEIGYVTSGSYAPFLKKNIALAYVPPEHSTVDSELAVEIRGQAVKARVVPTPFYKRPKKTQTS